MRVEFWVLIFELTLEEDNPKQDVTQMTHYHAHFCSVVVLVVLRHTHTHTRRTAYKCRIEKSFHQVIIRSLALPECYGYHIHNDDLTLL